MTNVSSHKPKLKNESIIIKRHIANKDRKYIINLENSFSLEKKNICKIIDFINNQISKEKKTNILIITNLSFQIFNRRFIEKLILKEINARVHYIDYNSFLNTKNISDNKYNFILFFPDTSDFLDISKGSDDLYLKKNNYAQITNYYDLLINNLSRYDIKVFIGNLVNFERLDFGTYTKKLNNLRVNLINKLNQHLLKITLVNNFYLFDIETITYKFGINRYRDPSKFFYGRVPFTIEYSDFFFSILANLISIALGRVKKLLILDLDNTLWGGNLGDDGPHGIILGNDTPLGRAFLDFQRTILNLQKRGVLIAICSKNELKNVQNVFKTNQNLILKFNHFVSVKANWNNKAQNIKEISDELNLGTESFVFFDDNPVERDLVRLHHPEVSIPELGDDPSLYSSLLLDSYYFDLLNFSKEDLNRSKTYSENSKREKLKNKFYNIGDYLKSLKMICNVEEFKSTNFERIVQLFQRTNQFNFTTIRYSLNEIKKISKDKNYVSFQFSLKDKFSNYGIISLMVCHVSKDTLTIDNWVMSCRVLNRTLENFIINKVVKYCLKKKIRSIKSRFIKTNKNYLIKNLFDELGFKNIRRNKNEKNYVQILDTFNQKKTYIKEL
jgi:FkbH-like protein